MAPGIGSSDTREELPHQTQWMGISMRMHQMIEDIEDCKSIDGQTVPNLVLLHLFKEKKVRKDCTSESKRNGQTLFRTD